MTRKNTQSAPNPAPGLDPRAEDSPAAADPTRLDRRAFIKGTLAAGSLLLAGSLEARARRTAAEAGDCGVASGDPRPDSVVLWTRVPDAYQLSGSLSVSWEVSTSSTFASGSMVASGTFSTGADRDFTVKVKATGLKPFTWYYYRFKTANGYTSVTGRTLTAPDVNADLERLNVAFVSCQSYKDGYYNVLKEMTKDDLHLCLHVGDFIYEYSGNEVRNDPIEVVTLTDFRAKYQLYLGDADLREVRRLFPWICAWDDHEVINNFAGGDEDVPEDIRERQRWAYQAYAEYMPIDPDIQLEDDNGIPVMRIHRSFRFGKLLEVFALDQRQYRDGPACKLEYATFGCEEMYDASRTMLGYEQLDWLKAGLSASTAQWKVLMNQLVMMAMKLTNDVAGLVAPDRRLVETYDGLVINTDQWDGFPSERAMLLQHIKDEAIDNVIVCSGDIHNYYAGVLRPDFTDPKTPAVAVEFVVGSVSSDGIAEDVGGADLTRIITAALKPANPHLEYLDAKYHGYTRLELGLDSTHAVFMAVDSIRKTTYSPFVLQSFTVMDGEPALIPGASVARRAARR